MSRRLIQESAVKASAGRAKAAPGSDTSAKSAAPHVSTPSLSSDRLVRFGSVCAFFLLWTLVCLVNQHGIRLFNPLLFPSPALVFQAGIDMARSGELWRDIVASMSRVLQGFAIAAVLGIGAGAWVGRSRMAANLIDPMVQILRPIPPLAFLPMMVLWFGIGEMSKIMFIAYATFFPIFTTTVEGIRFIDPVLLRAASSLGATRRDLFRYVVIPAALPGIMTGLRIGFGLAFFVIVAAEFIASDSGLGFLINDSRTFFQVPRMLLAAAVIGAIGYVFNLLLQGIEGRVLHWRVDARG